MRSHEHCYVQLHRSDVPCGRRSKARSRCRQALGRRHRCRAASSLIRGGHVRYANLDYGASAPALTIVSAYLNEILPYYASVHRGASCASQISTSVYENSRDIVREFVGGRPDDSVIFTRNTTDSLNLLAGCLPQLDGKPTGEVLYGHRAPCQSPPMAGCPSPQCRSCFDTDSYRGQAPRGTQPRRRVIAGGHRGLERDR